MRPSTTHRPAFHEASIGTDTAAPGIEGRVDYEHRRAEGSGTRAARQRAREQPQAGTRCEIIDHWHVGGVNGVMLRRGHLLGGSHIHPELGHVEDTLVVAVEYLLVERARPRRATAFLRT